MKALDSIDKVEMNVPARKEYARLLRLAVAGIASRMDFSFDGLEDLKIGLDEAFLLAVNDPELEMFGVSFDIYDDRLEIVVPGLSAIETLEDELMQKFGFSILHSVMDKVEWQITDKKRQLTMVKNIQ
jgi:anti-sigma regulatory factor (Ser/Thr protein kinase)